MKLFLFLLSICSFQCVSPAYRMSAQRGSPAENSSLYHNNFTRKPLRISSNSTKNPAQALAQISTYQHARLTSLTAPIRLGKMARLKAWFKRNICRKKSGYQTISAH